jgi:prolyl oligopeptidase
MSTSLDGPPSVVEELHGTPVADPYRWLEDRTSQQSECWIREQQRRCHLYFSGCSDLATIRNLVRGYLDVEIADQPAKVGHRLFFRRQNPGQEQAGIYVRDTNTNMEHLLVDPRSFGDFVSVEIHRISEDGSLLAFEVRSGGEDKKAILIVNTESGRILPDAIDVGYSRGFAFTANNDGLYYCQESAKDADEHRIWLHFFQSGKADRLIFRAPRAPESRLALIADSVNLAAIWSRRETSTLVADLYVATRADELNWKTVYKRKEWPHLPLLRYGRIFLLSSDSAQNSTLMELDSDGRELRTVLSEKASFIQQIVMARDSIYLITRREDCRSRKIDLCVSKRKRRSEILLIRAEPYCVVSVGR